MRKFRLFLKSSLNKGATCSYHNEKLKPNLRPIGKSFNNDL